jgi:AbrB family looped-hinge helix DNA binding protein
MKDRLGGRMPKFYGSVVAGERGQIVIPVEARRDMDIAPGEKLIILSGPQGNMLMIAKAESVARLLSKAMKRLSQFGSMLKADDEPPK